MDMQVADGPTDAISSLSFSPATAQAANDYLAVASWDSTVRIYEVTSTGQSKGVAMYQHDHQSPVLDVVWSPDGTKIASAGCDNTARMYDVATGQPVQVAQHDQPVKSVRFLSGLPGCDLVTGSWDKSLRYWDLRAQQPVATVALPERLYSMDVAGQYLVAACADRQNVIYNLQDPSKPYKQSTSALKWQTRIVRCFPSGTSKPGYASGSIEGRVSINYIDGPEKDNFSFRCHRVDKQPKPVGVHKPTQDIYCVNDIAFNHIGTFASCGGDGSFTFWDKDNKQRLKDEAKREGPITSGSFNKSATIFAYAVSYDWTQGLAGNNGQIPNKVMLYSVAQADIQKKPKKK